MTVAQFSVGSFNHFVKSKRFEVIMIISIIGYALFKRSFREVGDVFQAILCLGTIVSLYIDKFKLRDDKIIVCFAFSFVVPVASWLNSIIECPDLAHPYPNVLTLYSFFTFWLISYWIKGERQKIAIVLLAFCIGFILNCYSQSDIISEITRGLAGNRVDFNITNAQHPALFAGFAFIICIYYFVIACKFNLQAFNFISTILLVLITLLSILFVIIIIITQSREVWLALLVSNIVFIPVIYNSFSSTRIKNETVLLIYLFLFSFIMILSSMDIVTNRVNAERNIIKNILSLNFDEVPVKSSTGVRVHMWLEALDWIKKRPLLGSGDDARALVISESKIFSKKIKNTFSHLHNSHLETFVSYGVLGSFIIYFIMLFPLFSLLSNKRKDIDDLKVIALVFTIYWMTVNIFESFFYAKSGELVLSVYLGIIYSFKFTIQK